MEIQTFEIAIITICEVTFAPHSLLSTKVTDFLCMKNTWVHPFSPTDQFPKLVVLPRFFGRFFL